jgi:hypothetical protein
MTLEHLDTALGFAVIMLLLSLLITVLVQMFVAVSGLRGGNLLRGVQQILAQASPAMREHAGAIAERVLRHPAVAPIWKRRATAIRAEELVGLLQNLESSPGGPLTEEQRRALSEALAQPVGSVSKLIGSVNTWFGTIMDRTTERFVLQTRLVTATIALLFAVGLHIDSLQLLQRLATDGQWRAQLVAASQATLKQAEDMAVTTGDQRPLASRALAALRADTAASAAAATLPDPPPNLLTRGQGVAWLQERLRGAPSLTGALAAYHRHFDEETRLWLGELRAATSDITAQLGHARFELIPEPYPPLKTYWADPRHLIGVLMSALLLSLGAPFWFNVLHQLSNLRPAIAGKVEKKQTAK